MHIRTAAKPDHQHHQTAIKMRVSCRISLWAIVLLLYLETVVSQLSDKSNMGQFDKWSFLPENTPDKLKQHSNEARYVRAPQTLVPRWKKRIGFAGLDNMDVMTSVLEHTRQKDTSMDLRKIRNHNPPLHLSPMDVRRLLEAGK
ncbi:Hypothetical predicted protein [Octopus vulgaris]|uniref:Uncharacterized protein n=2 Tax=Octopus vulgaris TaxID=6645 RepID=A0AA36F248_OCTVU|nr:Hypothetical predicted protein [Octopus vulgaris]